MDDKETLELLFNTFVKMCDFIETSDNIGCEKCPCKNECILKGDNTEFLNFKPMVESIKNKI
ncbi:hypothetical protein [Clostridium sp. JS66]|uniref:hypothetical protein n=1 Tax=Clostridium sp. JS66 TaxID=3064705 RepID=UPI00298EA35B|nr:hypothetical protein [Clostridium sp. JS66]WPC39903.1 hypothetical protein Q6H37_18565 [Clostridium sp. JS66]